GHGQGAAAIVQAVGGFVDNGLPWLLGAEVVAETASLHNIVLYRAVKNQAVVEITAAVGKEVGDGQRRPVRIELQGDIAAVGFHQHFDGFRSSCLKACRQQQQQGC